MRDAWKNAELNEIRNIRFVCADAGAALTEMAEAGEKPDLVILDPPRAGASRAFIQGLRKTMPEKILYISCNPETQARDLVLLTAGKKYAVKAIQPVDMFPWTHHIENIVFLQRTDSEKPPVEKGKLGRRPTPAAPRAESASPAPLRRSQFANKKNRAFGHSGKKG